MVKSGFGFTNISCEFACLIVEMLGSAQIKYSNVRTGGALKYTVHSKFVSGMSVYVEEILQSGYPLQVDHM